MSDKILSSIFEFLKIYKDPENNNSFDQQNPKIQVVEKNGNVNVILSVTKQHLDKYEKLDRDIVLLKRSLLDLDSQNLKNFILTNHPD